jgi:hypothetical protein
MATNAANGSETGFDIPDDDDDVIIGTAGRDSVKDDDDSGIPDFDPATIRIDPEGNEPAKRRGRPRGSRNGASSKSSTRKEASDLTSLLLSAHFMLAAITKVPELEISQDEAKRLGEAAARVNEVYGGVMLPEKVTVLINLGLAAGTVYGPRILTYSLRMKNEAKEKKAGRGPQTIDAVM